MKLTLLITPSEKAAMRFRGLLAHHAKALRKAGVEAPEWNHVRLYAACAQTDEVGVLRHKRGLDHPLTQQTLTREFETLLAREVPELKGEHVVLAASQLGGLLGHPDELAHLHALLSPFFDDIHVVIHVEEQARALLQHYTQTIVEGRRTSLAQEIALAGADNWWDAARAQHGTNQPFFGVFDDLNCPPFWLDYATLLSKWEAVFGVGHVTLRPLDLRHLMSENAMAELSAAIDITNNFASSPKARHYLPEPAASLTRMRHMNDVMIRFAKAQDIFIPYDIRAAVHKNVRIDGPPIAAGSLHAISEHFQKDNAALIRRIPDVESAMMPDKAEEDWAEAAPKYGFRATQYLTAFAYSINKNATPLATLRAKAAEAEDAAQKFEDMLGTASEQMPLLNRVKVNHKMILSTQFKPHNNLGTVNENDTGPAYTPQAPRALPNGTSGTVIVACMKNEAPYILEWVAYHRTIGVDGFLIYTNDCTDGTDQILSRLQDLGVVQHRNNDKWKGKSPQQHALNQALKEPMVQNATWLIHIDVDEFINIRTGNGTLADLHAAAPDATNIAMTWRLFGHNGISDIHDEPVIDQFEMCAPKHCPKPHTVWGFKTMFRNIGAYAKMSCHRPNKLDDAHASEVKWINGSGQNVTDDLMCNGWRSSKSNIGYDLVQLNHYALRSADSFLIKRQRGRALHVDRSIGLNYWIRMDWSDHRDLTIKRNLPRLKAEMQSLLKDPALRAAHEAGFAWHRDKAAELRTIPEFATLYTRALEIELSPSERAAYALALDMQS